MSMERTPRIECIRLMVPCTGTVSEKSWGRTIMEKSSAPHSRGMELIWNGISIRGNPLIQINLLLTMVHRCTRGIVFGSF